jgi:hypothetical protein
MHHFWSNSSVLEWLPAEAFSPGPRREVYRAIITLARNEEPVDELTVDWQLAMNRTIALATSTNPEQAGQPAPEPGYVKHLAARTVPEGTATLTGRLLLNRHAAAQLQAGPGTPPGTPRQPSPSLPGASPQSSGKPHNRPVTTVVQYGPPPSFPLQSFRSSSLPLQPPPPSQGSQPGPEPRP